MSSQLTELLWTDPGLKWRNWYVRVDFHFKKKKKKTQAGSESSNLPQKLSLARKEPPPPCIVTAVGKRKKVKQHCNRQFPFTRTSSKRHPDRNFSHEQAGRRTTACSTLAAEEETIRRLGTSYRPSGMFFQLCGSAFRDLVKSGGTGTLVFIGLDTHYRAQSMIEAAHTTVPVQCLAVL